MKFINRLIAILLVATGLSITSCEFTELNLQDNPNAPGPDQGELEFLYNSIQLTFNSFYQGTVFNTAKYTRMTHMGAFTYNNATPQTQGNFLWTVYYANLSPDIDALITIADEAGANFEKGTSKIMRAYCLFTLVDLFGNVPYSQAGQGTDVISPGSDDAAGIYAAAIGLLDEAIADLGSAGAPAIDNYYDGDPSKWITLANTLKLRAYANTRMVDATAGDKIAALAGGDIIDEASEDFTWKYGTTRVNPGSRHPWYNTDYESASPGYKSNYYMWLLAAEKGIKDPRIRFYYYRQANNSINSDPNDYSCHLNEGPPDRNAAPNHYLTVDANMPYCTATDDGYYGRDHGNGTGTPPDGGIRTAYGLYPAGGRFDENSYDLTDNDGVDGALGEGISPIWLSSFTHFVLAEAALMAGTGGDAAALLEEGIRQSIAKTRSFESLLNPSEVIGTNPITGEPLLLGETYLDPLDDDTEDYVELVMLSYATATTDDERLNIIAKEYLLALWGNGLESYNMYRRTAKPNNIQPTLETTSGNFIQTWLYPADHVNRNANVTQKSTDELPFWSTLDPSQFNR